MRRNQYSSEKRRKELDRKKKQEEKRQKKLERKALGPEDGTEGGDMTQTAEQTSDTVPTPDTQGPVQGTPS